MRTQLLCTFSTRDRLDDILELIIECNDILYDKVYVFQNLSEPNQMICTYNVTYEDDYVAEDIPNTISLHRKKQTNTLYSINALNEVIRSLNNGVLDKRFPVPWENYKNSLLLTNDAGLNKIPTKLYKIVDTKNFDRI
jgi:hypothetical protein|tara:strand:+ start:1896 stop:2309 length:414 start_codon:yes stop_codon:yes gene_type:complete